MCMRQVLQQQTRVSLLWFLEGHFISGLGHDPEQSLPNPDHASNQILAHIIIYLLSKKRVFMLK